MCQLCDELGYRWTVCETCGIEFPYQSVDQLSLLETGRMDDAGGLPWFVEGHVPEWLLPSMVWEGTAVPDRCHRCDPGGWRVLED